MSAEATGWVFKNSPYKGAAFAVHLSMADSVNDQNENEFWMSITNLGIKARVARETAARAVSQMVEDGVLELIQDNSNIGRPSRYCFLMPEGVTRDHTPVIRDDTPVTRDHTPVIQDHTNPSRTQREPKEPFLAFSFGASSGKASSEEEGTRSKSHLGRACGKPSMDTCYSFGAVASRQGSSGPEGDRRHS